MKDNKKKKIKILSNGVLKVYGHINGPVLTPYYEDISVIVKLISSGVKVVEVSDNGSETLLTVSSVLEEKEEVKEEKKIEEAAKEELKEEVKEEIEVNEPESSDEKIVEESEPDTKKNYSSDYNYKKNKHKK